MLLLESFILNIIYFLNFFLVSNIHIILILFLSRKVFAFYKYIVSWFLKKNLIILIAFLIAWKLESWSTWIWRVYILKYIYMLVFADFMIFAFILVFVSIWVKLVYMHFYISHLIFLRWEAYLVFIVLNLSKR